jgi:hypothetical protein
MYYNRRPGCLGGILRLLFLTWLFDWLQDNFGFRRGPLGWGCGVILMVILLVLLCGVVCNTAWWRPFSPVLVP